VLEQVDIGDAKFREAARSPNEWYATGGAQEIHFERDGDDEWTVAREREYSIA
jgi:hypothetical protein